MTKLPSQEGNKLSNSDISIFTIMDLTLKKEFFISRIVVFDPKLTSMFF